VQRHATCYTKAQKKVKKTQYVRRPGPDIWRMEELLELCVAQLGNPYSQSVRLAVTVILLQQETKTRSLAMTQITENKNLNQLRMAGRKDTRNRLRRNGIRYQQTGMKERKEEEENRQIGRSESSKKHRKRG
jgi:hypothetical protein